MASLGTLSLDLVAKIGGFTGPLDKASRHSKKTSADISKAGKAMGVALGAGAVAAAAGVAMIVIKQRELIDQQAKSAQQLDTTYESMAVLQRAGELGGVGMEKITAASRQLNLNLGKAIQGSDAQVEAFKRLSLSAQEVYDLPLDQRIATINQALRDNVQSSERAAVAAEIFGAESAKSIQQLDPATIAEANRQAEIFGLKLSDVDAAKVEMANDALSTFGLLGDGIGKQLTVELAPLLKALGEEFLNSAEEAGGLGNVVQDVVGDIVDGMAFVVDAADGVGRAFDLVADGIIAGINTALSFVANNAAGILSVISYLPGIDYSDTVSSLEQFAIESNTIAGLAMENIEDTLTRPLAGENFKQFYKDAQAAAEAAAEATVEGRKVALASGEAFVDTEKKKTTAAKQTRDAIGEQIKALQLQTRTLRMSADEEKLFRLEVEGATKAQLAQASAALKTIAAFEQNKKIQEDYKDLVADLRTEEEKRTDGLYEQLKVLDAMQDLPPAERDSVAGRIAAGAIEDAPEFGGLDPTVGGVGGEIDKLNDAEKQLNEWYATQLAMFDEFRAKRTDLSATWDAEELEKKKQYEDSMAQIERARQRTALAVAGEIFGNLAALSQSENKKLVAIGKAAAIAQATISGFQAIQNALAVPPYPLGVALAVTAGVATAANIASIAGVGMAHDGIMSVPKTGTWLLEKGERVTTAGTSAKLDATLARIQAGQASGSSAASSDRPVQIVFNQTATDSRGVRDANAHAARKIARIVRGSSRYD